MGRIDKSLECPYCHGEHGSNISCKMVDTIEKEENANCTVFTIKRDYKCHCDICKKDYTVDYGMARLIKYNPYIYDANDDIKLYVDYESQFDRSYKIMEVNDIPMITLEDDDAPIILERGSEEELIEDHDKARKYTYNIWMTRHR